MDTSPEAMRLQRQSILADYRQQIADETVICDEAWHNLVQATRPHLFTGLTIGVALGLSMLHPGLRGAIMTHKAKAASVSLLVGDRATRIVIEPPTVEDPRWVRSIRSSVHSEWNRIWTLFDSWQQSRARIAGLYQERNDQLAVLSQMIRQAPVAS